MDCSLEYTYRYEERILDQDIGDDRFTRIKQSASNHINSMTEEQIMTKSNEDTSDLRILLLGQVGGGKSSLGNKILGSEEFESRPFSKSVTKRSQKGVKFRFGRNLTVVDTPGLNNMELTEKEIAVEIANCVMMSSPGPHCFLLAIPVGTIAEGFKTVISFIADIFGEEMFKRTVVVFTKADALTRHNLSVEDYINQDPELSVIVQRCSRYMTIDTNYDAQSQIRYLLDKIDEIHLQQAEGYHRNGYFRVPAQATDERESRKNQREEAKFRRMVRPMMNQVLAQLATLTQKIKAVEEENTQLRNQIKVCNEENSKQNIELDKYKKDVLSLQKSLDQTNNNVSTSTRRQTRAMSKLTVEHSALKEELCKRGTYRVLPPRGFVRQRPYNLR